MERIRIRNDRFSLLDAGNQRVPLTSFAGTSLMATDDEVYVTSGDDGHVTAYDEDDMTLRGQYALDDARWVAWDEPNNRVVVLQGTPGRLAVFQEGSFPSGSMTLLNTWSVPGVDVPESKNTVEVAGGKAYVAAGPAGVQVVCLSTGAVIGSVPVPSAAALGLDPSVVVSNAVTVDNDLMFISNGEAGVYAAVGSRDFDSSSCSPITITVLGRLRFDDLESVNHVAYRGGHLYIAAGLGGVKVVDVDTN
jgi:outer membrane protein assembly factor BamB